jgi:hypothetical protein
MWTDNDEPTYRTQRLVKEDCTICSKDVGALAHSLRYLATEEAPEIQASFYSDVMMASVREVDYYEVAKSLLED